MLHKEKLNKNLRTANSGLIELVKFFFHDYITGQKVKSQIEASN
jgi:hypothetical protein